MAEDMEVVSRYEEADYEEYAEEAEARIEPFRRRRKPYRFQNPAQLVLLAMSLYTGGGGSQSLPRARTSTVETTLIGTPATTLPPSKVMIPPPLQNRRPAILGTVTSVG